MPTQTTAPARPSSSPSPPPLPPTLPIPSAPGPRFLALQKIFHNALTSTLKQNSYANFAQCFPTAAQHCPAALEGVWRQLNEKFEEGCRREFEAIVEERNVVEGLNGWDGLVEEAGMRLARGIVGGETGKAPHALSADELYTAYLTPYLQQATQVLQTRLQNNQKQNTALAQRITEQRSTVGSLIASVEGLIADLEGSAEALAESEKSLTAETWNMSEETREAGMNIV